MTAKQKLLQAEFYQWENPAKNESNLILIEKKNILETDG